MHLKNADTRLLALLGAGLLCLSAASWMLLGTAAQMIVSPLCAVLVVAVVLDRHRSIIADQERQRTQVQALLDLNTILRARAPLPPMAGWACTPELAVAIVDEHLRSTPRCVVEAGSGVSTLVHGYMLERSDGRVWSLDHDLAFAERTRSHVAHHGLEARATIVDAPLIPYELRGESWQWYDIRHLPESREIDLLVVDGPPVSTQPLARYPALPLLVDRLADEAVIILDDAARPSERAVVQRWLAEYPNQLEHEFLPTLKGTSILRWRRHGSD